MIFNSVFLLLTGVVLCMEGGRGAASPQFRQPESSSASSAVEVKNFLDKITRLLSDLPKVFDDMKRALFADTPPPSVSYCEWDKDKDFSQYPPLLMDNDTWTSILPVWSDGKRVVRIPSGSSVVIACPETIIRATRNDVREGVCNGGHVLNVDGKNYSMTELGCESLLKESVRRLGEPCGYNTNGNFSSIGYEVTGYKFYELFKVCFHKFRENTLYTEHTLRGKSVNAFDKKEPRRSFFRKDPKFYSISPNRCYNKTLQKEFMDKLLSKSSIIDPENARYFVKGHLAPDADFPTKMEAHATYRYTNAAPQWKIYNDGNWRYMENAVRDFASRRGTDFKVWTGPWGTLELNDTTGYPHSIYLGLYEDEEVLPVPEVMWKLVYEPSTNRAVVFIVVNRPDVTSFPIDLCTSICDQIKWIDFNTNDPEKGVTKCCSMKGLSHIIPKSAPLKNVPLLTG